MHICMHAQGSLALALDVFKDMDMGIFPIERPPVGRSLALTAQERWGNDERCPGMHGIIGDIQ